jgi:DNA-binding MarR family transcriptional regulator
LSLLKETRANKIIIDESISSWYVHFMNNKESSGADHFRSLQILDELSNNDSLTQRDLSSRLGIALGLVNSYIKNLISKGYITVKAIPPKRYAYYLTPKGFAEKTRLTYDLLHDYTRIYRETRSNVKKMFHDLQEAGVKKIVFAGADEVAEIAYISLQETGIELSGVVDDDKEGKNFFGRPVQQFERVHDLPYDIVLVSSYLKRNRIFSKLVDIGVQRDSIRMALTEETEKS